MRTAEEVEQRWNERESEVPYHSPFAQKIDHQ